MGRDKMIGHRSYVDGMGNIKRKRLGNVSIPKSRNVWECIERKEREIEISDKSVVFAYQQFLAGKIE